MYNFYVYHYTPELKSTIFRTCLHEIYIGYIEFDEYLYGNLCRISPI